METLNTEGKSSLAYPDTLISEFPSNFAWERKRARNLAEHEKGSDSTKN